MNFTRPNATLTKENGFSSLFTSPPSTPPSVAGTAQDTNPNILWGTAAAAALGLFNAKIAEKKRKEAEARQRIEARRNSDYMKKRRAEKAGKLDEYLREKNMTEREKKHRKELQKIWDANGAAIYEANKAFESEHGHKMDSTIREKAIAEATVGGVFNAGLYSISLTEAQEEKERIVAIQAAINEMEAEKKIGDVDPEVLKAREERGLANQNQARDVTPFEVQIPYYEEMQSNTLLSEGTIQLHNEIMLPGRQLWLATKAEEGYGDFGLAPVLDFASMGNLAKAITYSANGTSMISDFHNDIPSYSINTEIHWEYREQGLLITSVEVMNYAPTAVEFSNVHFRNILGEHYTSPGTDGIFGINGNEPGVSEINTNLYLHPNFDTNIVLEIHAAGAYPTSDMASMSVFIPAGTIPPAGCSAPLLAQP